MGNEVKGKVFTFRQWSTIPYEKNGAVVEVRWAIVKDRLTGCISEVDPVMIQFLSTAEVEAVLQTEEEAETDRFVDLVTQRYLADRKHRVVGSQ